MILPTAAAIALIATVLAAHTALHHHQGTLLAEFENDLDAHRGGGTWHGPVSHRLTAEPGSDAYKTIHTTTQPIPTELRKQVLAGPKEHR